jgi:hypothetical protein
MDIWLKVLFHDMKPNSILNKMKYREELEKEYNSIEGILYRLDTFGDATTSDVKDKIVIAETLQELPKEVREKVLDEVLFIIMRALGTTRKLVLPCRISEKDIEEKRIGKTGIIGGCLEIPIIVLNFSVMRKPSTFEGNSKEYRKSIIAHEIAHFILGHHVEDDPKKERKADDLIEEWGFKRAYKSYEQFEGSSRA